MKGEIFLDFQSQIRKLQQNKTLVDQLMNSSDGQKLLSMLTKDGGTQLKNATDAAAKGNTADMVRMIAELMKSDEGSQIIHNLNQRIK